MTSSMSMENLLLRSVTLGTTQQWGTLTHLGRPVVPEVCNTYTNACGGTTGKGQRAQVEAIVKGVVDGDELSTRHIGHTRGWTSDW